jgi:hypothetical protein
VEMVTLNCRGIISPYFFSAKGRLSGGRQPIPRSEEEIRKTTRAVSQIAFPLFGDILSPPLLVKLAYHLIRSLMHLCRG